MIKSKINKLLALAIALAVFAVIPLSVSANSQNANGNKKAPTSSTQEVKSSANKTAPGNTTVTKTTVTKTTVTKSTVTKKEAPKPAPKKPVKPQLKTGVQKQLSEIGTKLSAIESDVNKLGVVIDTYVKANTTGSAIDVTTGSAINTTGSAINTTGSAINTTGSAINLKNRIAFVASTTGKIKAYQNKLAGVEKSLRALSGKLDKNANEQYKSLVSRAAAIKEKLAQELQLVKTLNVKK